MLLSRTETLEQVFPLLAPDASYRSDALGSSWEGREAIRGMMEGFFAKLPDVRWEVRSLAVEPSSAPQGVQGVQGVRVAVEFTRYWTNEEGQAVVATGREWIYVDPAGGPGSIQHVHVAKLDP
ncbi:hypothetical protein HYH03_011135 [Edaphochlamys debaryana]|uniref:SnoaL-like domain-containing protein n=1 Tax=Edaphochlamys debaryana TaxID=47281 RepID=A0A836BWU3_9CHLO|nr:hypothetical protein HYH03_011135 [Edaphochlamys debaryana]|eukprot:KAG2490513.1 hypothetical protein HYH03_011135 [Edaphochlamys debaryana]